MSCCGRNNGNFYSRPTNQNKCCNNNILGNNNCCDNDCDNDRDDCCDNLNGISCPNHNNNDCNCEHSLRDAACRLTNQRVIIHTEGCKMCVVIVSVGQCFLKAINPCTHRIVYFNIDRIDNIEDVLPRC